MNPKIRFGFVLFIVCVIGPAFNGCTRAPVATESSTVLSRLDQQISGSGAADQKNANYLALFENETEAREHANQMLARGAAVKQLGDGGRLLAVKADVKSLANVSISEATQVSLNTRIRLNLNRANRHTDHGSTRETLNKDIEEKIQSALEARKVLGVEELLEKIPTADGRQAKVAVFDTGIDFGVEGIEFGSDGNRKLEGFFDLTGFGAVESRLLDSRTPKKTYDIEGITVSLQAKVLEVLAAGVLDEKALTDSYFAPEGVDLNANGKSTDRFAFLVGVNQAGVTAVYVDHDLDRTLGSDEELTDYNSTHRFLEMKVTADAPSGARPLAVTITSADQIQFHSVPHGHGTSCAIIIAGDGFADGRLVGMAPKAKLVSYVLDSMGQDVYTLDQFLAMFEHAKKQGVDAISISWGFSTADLQSARFVADYLDREIASKGILIGIAAGNEGPGLLTGAADDYVPHYGLAVGALVSQEQARNVYGWSGINEDTVVWYSSVGPSRGGRAIPDLISPLMSWVRGSRADSGPQFYAFSGTSSATPAMIGASTALISALKQSGEASEGNVIDPRLLKLALQNSARKLKKVENLRQGAGVPNVAKAYTIYKKLAAELRAAKADSTLRTRFAYELRAQTLIDGSPDRGEGVHLKGYRSNAEIIIGMTASTQALVDPLVTVEPLLVSHDSDFFETAEVLPLQSTGERLTLRFRADRLEKAGIYTDVLTLSRPSDGLVLLTIPVAVEIASSTANTRQGAVLDEVDMELGPFSLSRHSVRLEGPDSITFEGLIQQTEQSHRSYLFMHVRDAHGTHMAESTVSVSRNLQAVRMSTPQLPAGQYEVIFFRHFSRPAVLNSFHLTGSLRSSLVKTLGSVTDESGGHVQLALQARENLTIGSASLVFDAAATQVKLVRESENTKLPAFVGELDLGEAQSSLAIGLRQNAVDRAMESLLHMSVAMLSDAGDSLYRGWINFQDAGSPLTEIGFLLPTQRVQILAYPNIVEWKSLGLQSVEMDVEIPLKVGIEAKTRLTRAVAVEAGQVVSLDLELAGSFKESGIPANAVGTLVLKDATGEVLETLRVGSIR